MSLKQCSIHLNHSPITRISKVNREEKYTSTLQITKGLFYKNVTAFLSPIQNYLRQQYKGPLCQNIAKVARSCVIHEIVILRTNFLILTRCTEEIMQHCITFTQHFTQNFALYFLFIFYETRCTRGGAATDDRI